MPLNLNAEISGEDNNETIIILHGLFGSAKNWRSISRRLAEKYRVICLDLCNHGDSPWHEEMNYTEMAADVAQFIENNRVIKPNIIGHSMGGKTAMTLLQESNSSFGHIFIADIAPIKYPHSQSHVDLIDTMLSVDLSQEETRSDIDVQLAINIEEIGVRQFLMQNLNRGNDGHYEWKINLNNIKSNIRYLIDYNNNIICYNQIIFISGSLSDYIKSENHAVIYQLFPNAVIETISGAGHWLHAEKPEAFLRIVNKYLDH